MSHYLAFRRMPWHLKTLSWLLLIDGVARIVIWLISQGAPEAAPARRLITAGVFLYAAIQLRRGRRDGLDLLLYHNVALVGVICYGLIRGAELSAWQWGMVAFLALMTVYVIWCRARLPWQEAGSYGHWMADPDYQEDVEAWFAARNRIVEQDRLDPPDPDEVVRDLIDGDMEMARQRIAAQPGHFGMAIFRALDDSAFLKDEDALTVLVDNLPESLHVRALDRLTRCLDRFEDFMRGSVLRKIAATGRPEIEPLLLRELAGSDANDAAEGLANAIENNRLDDTLFEALEPALRECLDREEPCEHAAVVLARMNPSFVNEILDRAQELGDAPMQTLVALGEAEVPLDPGAVLQIWRRARDRRSWFWCWQLTPFAAVPDAELRDVLVTSQLDFGDDEALRDWASGRDNAARYSRLCYARALAQLAERHPEQAEVMLREAIALDRDEVSDDAAALLARHLGADGEWSPTEDAPPTAPERALHSLHFADSLACNGGLLHAIRVLDEQQMAAFTAALRTIAPPVVSDIWQRAFELLSEEPIPTDQEQRREIVQRRFDAICDQVDALDTEYYRQKWQLTVAMHLFAIEHRDELAAAEGHHEARRPE